jgi:hypothetical protein
VARAAASSDGAGLPILRAIGSSCGSPPDRVFTEAVTRCRTTPASAVAREDVRRTFPLRMSVGIVRGSVVSEPAESVRSAIPVCDAGIVRPGRPRPGGSGASGVGS